MLLHTDLVGEADEDGEEKDVHLPVVRFTYLPRRVRQKLVRHTHHRQQTHGKVISVGLDEVVAGD